MPPHTLFDAAPTVPTPGAYGHRDAAATAPARSLRVIIADDELLARRRLARLISDVPGMEIVAQCASGAETVEALREERADLLLLDVQMPDMDGFEVIRRAGATRTPETIFVTAFDRNAIRAFETSAIDYLLKPYEAPRFRDALERARQRATTRRTPERAQQLGRMLTALSTGDVSDASAPVDERAAPLERFVIKNKDQLIPVMASDVDWIESARNYVRLHVGETTHTMRETLAALEARLDPMRFARMHRRVIVNLERVREVQPWFGGDHVVILTNGHKLRLSRSFRRRFLERLQRAK